MSLTKDSNNRISEFELNNKRETYYSARQQASRDHAYRSINPLSLETLLRQQQLNAMALSLPKPEVPVFGGDAVEYCNFIRAFENIIEVNTTSSSQRLYYLVQYTKGDVQELMRSCQAMNPDEGYREARQLLKKRFGQNYRIATAYVEKITKGPVIKKEDGPALQKFSVLLTSCINILREIGYMSKIENPESLRMIIARLPYDCRKKWRTIADSITEEHDREITFADIANFVEKQARIVNHPVFGKISMDIHENTGKQTRKSRNRIE